MSRLIDADALIKKLGIGDFPIRLTYEINHAPTVDAIPIDFIEKKIDAIRQYVEKHGGEIDIEEFIDGLISKAVAYERLIEEWREENGQANRR